jgi:hypothetical protein
MRPAARASPAAHAARRSCADGNRATAAQTSAWRRKPPVYRPRANAGHGPMRASRVHGDCGLMSTISHEADPTPTQRARRRRTAVLWAGILAGGITLAGCGGDSSAPGASGRPAVDVGGTQPTGLLSYASCMRSHGVPNFPDPSSGGGIPKETGQQLGVSESQLSMAQNDCRHLIPPGQALSGQTSQTVTTQQQQDYLKVTACMHSRGFPSFPEPSFSGGQVEFAEVQHLVDINSPQFTQAYHVCQKLIPAGLPFSGSGS